MNAKAAIRNTIDMSDFIVQSYIGDLTDAELLERPAEGMNHVAWQLGHLIAAERMFVEMLRPGTSPALPDGFADAHSKEAAGSSDPSKFLPRARYQELWKVQREASLRVLEAVDDAELGEKSEKYPEYAQTPGAILNMVGIHPLMHVGQWVIIRRKAGKPIVI